MALRTNATLTFTSYVVTDEGIILTFVSPDPGAGQVSDYAVLLTDAELATVVDLSTFTTLLNTKLKRLYRAQGIANKLDAMIGRSLTI